MRPNLSLPGPSRPIRIEPIELPSSPPQPVEVPSAPKPDEVPLPAAARAGGGA